MVDGIKYKRIDLFMKKHNFSSGPAILPPEVFEQAAAATIEIDGMGLSILEISHRSPKFKEILEEARTSVVELLHLDDDYEVLYLTGGASSQFFVTAYNLLNEDEMAGFINTGNWSKKAIKEAKAFGKVNVIASSEDKDFTYIPKNYRVPEGLSYLHITSNNTIYGTQFHKLPEANCSIVCDMSSDIFGRVIDSSKYGLIYAGAQKNLGPAGTTLVIVRRDILGRVKRHIPTMLDYRTHIKKGSAFNTPPVFPIFVSMLNLRWLNKQGGVAAMERKNRSKAAMMYEEIDRNGLFEGRVAEEDRSIMNATFDVIEEQLQPKFLDACKQADIAGIKGHRTVGGFRASMYNAMPLASVKALVEVMKDFEQKFG